MVISRVIDMLLLRDIRNGNENALSQTIKKYTAYVCTIIRNTAGEALTHEDVEEVASDVFLALWEHSDNAGNLKAYIAATARNKAKNKLREAAECLPLYENILAADGAAPDDALISADEQHIVRSAVLAMEDTDREIILRHYYGSQTVACIACEMGMGESAVKMRLARGKEKLKSFIIKEGLEV
jgi:RNA polymerase sigma-70 factor (ECF subfamily)